VVGTQSLGHFHCSAGAPGRADRKHRALARLAGYRHIATHHARALADDGKADMDSWAGISAPAGMLPGNDQRVSGPECLTFLKPNTAPALRPRDPDRRDGEFVPGYEASTWSGVGAPKATPAEIIDKLNKEINAGLADPKLKARLAELGGTVLAASPTDFGKLITDETEKWGNVIRTLNIKAE
jgi:tripartite tricarboxylate transporter family receptor